MARALTPRLPARFLRSVAGKLFGGFLAMALLIAALGGFALSALGQAGGVVEDTYDRPLMAVNFARSASQTFAMLEIESLRAQGGTEADTVVVDRQAQVERFDELSARFAADLQVARERSISDRAAPIFDAIDTDFAVWVARERAAFGGRASAENHTRALAIEENLDIVVELQTNESFRDREAALAGMAATRRLTQLAAYAALALAVGLTIWIGVTIIRPLKSAAGAAARISAGDFDVAIPAGGEDETGQLLRTLSDMRDNIRRRMEQEQDARALAQARLSDSLENSQDAVVLTDREARIIVANPAVGDVFAGLAQLPELLGRDARDFVGPDGVPRGATREAKNRAQSGQCDFQLAGGRWYRVNASATREGGRLFIWTDITQSRQTAQRLREARDAAQTANRAKSRFLAAMSHELNTPLNAIIGLADVIGAGAKRSDTKTAEMARMISDSGMNMARIVRDVLEIASDEDADAGVNAGRPLDRARLCKAVDRSVHGLRDTARETGVRLLWACPPAPIDINGDAADLQLLVDKLLHNALRFNRPGGTAKVELRTLANGRVRLDVIDNGIGIAEGDLSRIMEPFTQASEGFSRTADGTGLGLAVAARIARRHGSTLEVRSREGRGSVFSVTFPAPAQDGWPSAPDSQNRTAA